MILEGGLVAQAGVFQRIMWSNKGRGMFSPIGKYTVCLLCTVLISSIQTCMLATYLVILRVHSVFVPLRDKVIE